MKPFKIYVFTFLNHNCFIVVCSLEDPGIEAAGEVSTVPSPSEFELRKKYTKE